MPFPEIFSRFAIAAVLTTCFCVPLGLALLRVTGVPPTYPPLLPQQILSGTVGGALLVSLGYWLLCALFPDKRTRHAVFLSLAVILCLTSFQLAARLSYTQSPRFAGVTLAAQIGQCVLHTLVVFLSVICFLTDDSAWG
ncbi:hypothetical protein IAD21_00999 [Abditibacteriota bacterium]|nr:hypothetical protein IAD21_00999 [Abditibacteriota bacterium]